MYGVLQSEENESGPAVEVTDGIVDLSGSFPTAEELALAFIILVIGWFVSKLVVRMVGRTIAQRIERPSITRTVLRGVRVSVLLVTVVFAAYVLGVSGGEIFLSVTVISAVIAVVLAPLVSSFINGFFVLADRPYEIGDMIEVVDEGHRGFVEDITIRYTKIFTLENTFIVIPNSEIQQRDVVNYSAEDERTRISVEFEITYESDLEAAMKHAQRGARNVDDVITGGPDIRIGSARYAAAPICAIEEYANDGIVLTLYFWIDHPYKQAVVKSDVQQAIRDRFADLDVEFAYPHRHHVFDETSGVARMVVDGQSDRDSPTEPKRGRPRATGSLETNTGNEQTERRE
ncbi:mechanosensitive ion channel family protein [Natronobacterium gregoryi]|uniref:Mechanosensitive ion channel MscS n=2 Tax=Natronobacterium gregoryi TaxID=44930 RepID=L0AN50_NATGS|nr:mechanosensitive ion channel family protein [Natronobacterium gregoryi]AFZ74904.1 small-conductance mechanosensitive channel [Natronobacterium gregoryi SP2]ELY67601.1 mechanosensitive ion channel MscS [Natronobacterium gregoryi SP2]PLK18272.1 mechanosensitive ion channel family protein [Natronobacterium gregoryi SP2]SFJ72730.1 Small-conductance mechanosensitive channel [Natronobacterium gregoryi]